jgi:hypothetical protein
MMRNEEYEEKIKNQYSFAQNELKKDNPNTLFNAATLKK